jgi:hypothetical protein
MKPDSTPLQNTIKLLVWAGCSLNTFGRKKLLEVFAGYKAHAGGFDGNL